MTQHKNKNDEGKPLRRIFYGLVGLGLLLTVLLKGKEITLFNPQGLMAAEEHKLMLVAIAVMMVIAVPTLFFFYYFAWKYRETNDKVIYEPVARHGKLFFISLWAFPGVIMIILSVIMWTSTHRLEPQDPIASNAKPITIQVVALRWKWLFIYPEQKIATVNFIEIPTNTPVKFELTADDAPMSSFWIPHLSGQLYAMTGHVNHLNLIAGNPGDYPGSSAELNGPGFAGMKFVARASSRQEFDTWVGSIQQSFVPLDSTKYEKLLKPSEDHQYEYFSTPEAGLYDKVVMKYSGAHAHSSDTNTEHE